MNPSGTDFRSNRLLLPGGEAFSPPPILSGFHFDPNEVRRARDGNALLSLQVDLGRVFQADREGRADGPRTLVPRRLRSREIRNLIDQARTMGAKSIVLSGIAAPDSSPHFRGLVSYIHSLGMIPVAAVNALTLTGKLAAFLSSRRASVLVRAGGMARAAEEGNLPRYLWRTMRLLREEDFSPADSHHLRLGISVTDERIGEDTAVALWRFCRSRGIYPLLRMLTPVGMDSVESGRAALAEEVEQRRTRLLRLDREEYGYTWPPFTPHLGSGCLRHRAGLYVSCEGNVRPCGAVALDKNPEFLRNGMYVHNIRYNTLSEIYGDALFRYIRNIEQHLDGKSGECEHLDTCIGCRGAAYIHRIRDGVEPLSALRSECPYCFKEKGEFHGQND